MSDRIPPLQHTKVRHDPVELGGAQQAKSRHAEIRQAIGDGSEEFGVRPALHLWVGRNIWGALATLASEPVTTSTARYECSSSQQIRSRRPRWRTFWRTLLSPGADRETNDDQAIQQERGRSNGDSSWEVYSRHSKLNRNYYDTNLRAEITLA